MRRRILEASTRLLLVLVVATYCSAQTAKPGDGGASGSDDNGYGSPIGDGTRREQAYLSSSAHKSPSHEPSGYISGTIFDESGAVSTGADVSLSREVQTSDRKVKSGSNGEFLFSNVAPGSFSLRVTAPGFATREFSATLDPGKAYLVPPIFLAVASAVTKVDVNASPLTPVQVADMQIEEQEKQRIFGLIPNFYATYDRGALPLNSKQKFRLAWKTTKDPFTVVAVAAVAGVEQATNAFEGYGQGAQGYFKRLGATYTNVVTGTFIGSAVLPSLLKQDPRYFYKGTGSTRSRLLYALASPVICKGDNMRWQPNYSTVAGAFASAGLSYLYVPKSDHDGAGLMVQNSLIRLGEVSFEGVLQEFVLRRFTPRLRNRASDQR